MSFSSLELHKSLERGIAELGFSKPTPIQKKAIPHGLAGRDLLACAMTGSGKTAAFLLPILQRLLGKKPGTTRALILTPTRELAAQIVEHFEDLARFTRLRAAAVYGGVGMNPQKRAFHRGVDVLVACPGRLLDHFQYDYARLQGLEILVLDEADRMLDMGFLPDIRRVLRHIPRPQQTLFFSATMPEPIVELSQELLKNPVQLDVERPQVPATGVSQTFYPVRQDLKTPLLMHLLETEGIYNALVFTRTKRRADRLAKALSKQGIDSDRIHGDRTQGQRMRALEAFKKNKIQVLVATDIAARGIDVEALSHVINFDVPHLPEDYIHRVGRTARARATGEAFTFVAPFERNELRAIERAVGKRIERRVLDGFGDQDTLAVPPENGTAQGDSGRGGSRRNGHGGGGGHKSRGGQRKRHSEGRGRSGGGRRSDGDEHGFRSNGKPQRNKKRSTGSGNHSQGTGPQGERRQAATDAGEGGRRPRRRGGPSRGRSGAGSQSSSQRGSQSRSKGRS
jgi:ATP-dependent RNA helicase RhlE